MVFLAGLAIDWSLLGTIFMGAVCGYVASRILGGEGFGFLGNIVVGIIGGFVGTWMVKIAKIPMIDGIFGNIITSVGGAILLILFIEIIKYLQRTNKGKTRTRR